MWEGNKAQAAALESVMIGGAKRILGCSSRTCNEAVRGDMGLDSLQGRRDKAKLKRWYKVATMPEHWYSLLVMLGQDYCLNSGQERMDSMKSWAGIEEGKAGRSVCCVMQSVRVLVMCCGIVLHTLVLEVPSCWS